MRVGKHGSNWFLRSGTTNHPEISIGKTVVVDLIDIQEDRWKRCILYVCYKNSYESGFLGCLVSLYMKGSRIGWASGDKNSTKLTKKQLE